MKYSLLFAIITFFLISCKKENLSDTSQNEIKDITSLSEFESSLKTGVSVVFFHASWCPKCAAQRPAVEGVSTDNQFNSVFFGEVEFEDHTEIVNKYDVVGFPTIVIYKNGSEVHRFEGQGHSQQTISDKIKTFL